MKRLRAMSGVCSLSLVLLACICAPLTAGMLDDFEKDATKASKPDTTTKREMASTTSCWWGCMESAVEMTIHVLGAGGSGSLMRVNPPGSADTLGVEPRTPGELQIPVVCLDLRHQDVESDVSALDARAEVGYGPLGLAVRYTHYEEESPADELDIVQWHGLYRMSFTERVEVDIGLGSLTLHGDTKHSGSSVTLPVRIGFDVPLALVFRPTWSWIEDNTIRDYDVGLLYL